MSFFFFFVLFEILFLKFPVFLQVTSNLLEMKMRNTTRVNSKVLHEQLLSKINIKRFKSPEASKSQMVLKRSYFHRLLS